VLPYGCRTGACGTCSGRLLEVEGTRPSDGECDGDGAIDACAVDDAVAYRRLAGVKEPTSGGRLRAPVYRLAAG